MPSGRTQREATGGIAGTSPCLAMTAFNFSKSGGPPAFTMAAASLKKSGPRSAGVMMASAFTSVCFRLLKPWTAPRGTKQDSPGRLWQFRAFGRTAHRAHEALKVAVHGDREAAASLC